MTSTLTDDQIIPLDESLVAAYQDAAEEAPAPTTGSTRRTPPRGAYALTLPTVIEVVPNKARTGVNVRMGFDPLHPVVVSGGDFDGYEMKYLTFSSVLSGSKESAAGSILRNFGWTREQLSKLYGSGSVSAWQAAFDTIAGQTTPTPVWCDWEGTDLDLAKQIRAEFEQRGEPIDWKIVRARTEYKGMGPARKPGGGLRFDTPDPQHPGQYLPWREITDGRTVTNRDGQTVPKRVWANLRPTFNGFLPKS